MRGATEVRGFYQDGPCKGRARSFRFRQGGSAYGLGDALGPAQGLRHGKRFSAADTPKAKITAKSSRVAEGQSADRKSWRRHQRSQVVTRIGPPDMKRPAGHRPKIARWSTCPRPKIPGHDPTLTFEHGRLVEVERKVVK